MAPEERRRTLQVGDGRASEGVCDWLRAEEEVGGEEDQERGEEEKGEEGTHTALQRETVEGEEST